MTSIKKNAPTILGGTSLKDKLSIARKELDNLQNDNAVSEQIEINEVVKKNTTTAHVNINIETETQQEPKFHLTGRCDRKKHKYATKAFYILEGLESEIKQYCNGGDVAIFNYLMHLGLNEIKRRQGHSFDEVSKMEMSYYTI